MKVLFFLLTFVLVSFGSVNLYAQNPPAELPAFKFTGLDGKPFTRENLKAGIPTVVFYFDPGCDHCQNQSKLIKAEIAKFAGCQFVMVTMEEEVAKIKQFQATYWTGVTNPTLHFVKDPMLDIDKFFGRLEVPSILVYDKNRKFKKIFRKEGSTEFKEIPAATIAGTLK